MIKLRLTSKAKLIIPNIFVCDETIVTRGRLMVIDTNKDPGTFLTKDLYIGIAAIKCRRTP